MADVTRERLATVDILVVSRDCLSRAFKQSHQKFTREKQTAYGVRDITEWDRIGSDTGQLVPLHPIYDPPVDEAEGWDSCRAKWDLLIVDEAHFMHAATQFEPCSHTTPPGSMPDRAHGHTWRVRLA